MRQRCSKGLEPGFGDHGVQHLAVHVIDIKCRVLRIEHGL